MAKSLKEWVATDVKRVKKKPLKWLSENHFFRDPSRPVYSDNDYLFSPADGVIIYQHRVQPAECIVEVKGKIYSLQHALQDEALTSPCLVIGIFMTMYDVHVNRIPYAGFLSYKSLDPLSSYNCTMLGFERSLVHDLTIDNSTADFLHSNQRVVNRIYSPELQQHYYVLQIADYDVDCITPFKLGNNIPVSQNERFSQIRFGSQVDLIVPVSDRFTFEPIHGSGVHVEGGVDPLVRVVRRR
ncbi:MAG: phosphatidylserine decarboxylase [Chloroflexota bacterium]|nr:phosphatidylserine decarboxylase [Chloroflexota bacterium]